ncbi:MAG: hypothetical protein HRT36_07355 [Alphaproteobacteria bacterium]|nr:hypothetical protein [Alphaproteobacteria bacterium]
MSFRELSLAGKRLPEEYSGRQYSMMFHGVGLCDEYIQRFTSLRPWRNLATTAPSYRCMVPCVKACVGTV